MCGYLELRGVTRRRGKLCLFDIGMHCLCGLRVVKGLAKDAEGLSRSSNEWKMVQSKIPGSGSPALNWPLVVAGSPRFRQSPESSLRYPAGLCA